LVSQRDTVAAQTHGRLPEPFSRRHGNAVFRVAAMLCQRQSVRAAGDNILLKTLERASRPSRFDAPNGILENINLGRRF